MTRAEILDCLTDRPCDSCKFHESGKCERWNCVFEEKPDEPKQTVGKWIYTKAVSTGEIIWSECSVCGEGEHGCAKRMKFCPNCGARMEERSDK